LVRQLSPELGESCAELIKLWHSRGQSDFLITQTVMASHKNSLTTVLRASCAVAECDGLWPHEVFADPRPIERIYGAIVNYASASWLVPLADGSATTRDASHPPVMLKTKLERRVRYALKVDRTSALPPLLGEFLIAHERRGPAPLIAALWTSPLGPDEDLAVRSLLDVERSGAASSINAYAARTAFTPSQPRQN
jgi:hypothetical protein